MGTGTRPDLARWDRLAPVWPSEMQGGSTGIVYGGLKYQVSPENAAIPSLWRKNPSTQIPFFPQARCIADVKADPDRTSFLAGTLSLREENEVGSQKPGSSSLPRSFLKQSFELLWVQVHLIGLSPSGTELVCEGLFYHPNEIWDLKSCPFDPRLFSTVFTSGKAMHLTIRIAWSHSIRIPFGHSYAAFCRSIQDLCI